MRLVKIGDNYVNAETITRLHKVTNDKTGEEETVVCFMSGGYIQYNFRVDDVALALETGSTLRRAS